VRTRGAKAQYVKLDDKLTVEYVEKLKAKHLGSQPIWMGSPGAFRYRLSRVNMALFEQPKLILPSSLRPGGATHYFQQWSEDVQRLMWRGRWQHQKTLVHYIQELTSMNVMGELSEKQRDKVQKLAELLPPIMEET
jgi:hypothetical protein